MFAATRAVFVVKPTVILPNDVPLTGAVHDAVPGVTLLVALG